MKPKNRKERIQWLQEKKGLHYVQSMYMLTDKEVKEWFEHRYNLYKDEPPYKEKPAELPECMVCRCEVRVIWNCACGEDCATLDPDDPELEERKLLFMKYGHI